MNVRLSFQRRPAPVCKKTFVFSLSMSGFHNVSHDGNYDRLKFCIFLEMHQLRTTGSFSQA